jgi:hypothetical protein
MYDRHQPAHSSSPRSGLRFEIVRASRTRPASRWSCTVRPRSQDEVERINAAGGALKGAKGVDANQYLPAAKLGVCKINIDTDGRLVWTRVHREYFNEHPEEFDLRPIGKIFMN